MPPASSNLTEKLITAFRQAAVIEASFDRGIFCCFESTSMTDADGTSYRTPRFDRDILCIGLDGGSEREYQCDQHNVSHN